MLVMCPRCRGVGRGYIDVDGGKQCAMCNGRRFVDVTPLRVLAANLVIGAALCASFDLGLYNTECRNVHPSVNWWPGCRWSSP
jgi:hypothetical protein